MYEVSQLFGVTMGEGQHSDPENNALMFDSQSEYFLFSFSIYYFI